MNRQDDNLEAVLGEAPELPNHLWARTLEGAFDAPITDVSSLLPEIDPYAATETGPAGDDFMTQVDAGEELEPPTWASEHEPPATPESLDGSDDIGL